MEIREKLYPYPVLATFTDDYRDSYFETVFDLQKDGYDLCLHILSELKNEELQTLLLENRVNFVYHIECSQTGYRVAVNTNRNVFEHRIIDSKVSGRLQVCSFIIACEDLSNYTNQLLHGDYSGFTFAIDRGNIMAVGSQSDFEIEKTLSDLSYVPSVIAIVKNPEVDAEGMLVSIDQNKIVIRIPENDFYNYRSLSKEVGAKSILRSLIIVPALAYVLTEVAKRDPSERYIYSSYSWYLAIKKNLRTIFECNIESEDFAELDMLRLAQRILNSPLGKALSTLAQDYGIFVGDGDEWI